MDVGRPVEILDKMVDLMRWWESPIGQRYGKAFISTTIQREKYPEYFDKPGVFADFQVHCLQRSLPYFITDQMVDKIWEFSKRFETVGFYPEEVPSPYGFMWLAKPVHTLDAMGKMQCQRAISWIVQDGGVAFHLYADKHDVFDETNLEMRAEDEEKYRQLPELSLNHTQAASWGDKTEWFRHDPEEYIRKYQSPTGEVYKPEDILVADEEELAFFRFIVACWEWMGYQLPSRALPHRQMARRLGRSRLDTREVLVIDLQATQRDHIPPATHQVVKWHYRFRSRAHKRHWVDKHGNHRVTDVVGCIKPQAPEYQDLPLVERDVLFNLRRGHAPI
jgi:hypothetical protein